MGNDNKKDKGPTVAPPVRPIEIRTYVMTCQNKMSLYRNKKVYEIKKKKDEAISALKQNNLDIAKAKMESIIRLEDTITVYDILVVISLPLGYLLYKAFNRYNDIHSIFRFYFIINCVLLFIFTFEYKSNYLLLFFVVYSTFNYVMDSKINIFFAVNYRNELTYFKLKVNKLVNLAYYFGKIIGSICLYFFINSQFYFLSVGTFIYFAASFYDRFIKLSKFIILGRSYSKEIN